MDNTLVAILAGLATVGAVWFLLNWLSEGKRLRSMTYIEVRNAQIEDELYRERRGSKRERLKRKLESYGYYGDPAPLAIGVAFGYLVLAAVLTIFGLPAIQAVLIALPASIGGTLLVFRNARKRRDARASAQVLQLVRTAVSYLESGSNPAQAFQKSAMLLDNPLRDEVIGLLAARVGTEPLASALEPLKEKYPSQAMTLLLAALEVNDMVGAKLAPTLRQAEAIIERQAELAAEAVAEVSQAKAEFIGITVIIALVGVMMIVNGGEVAKAAYSSFLGIVFIGIGVANFAFGVWRTMRTLSKAKEGDL